MINLPLHLQPPSPWLGLQLDSRSTVESSGEFVAVGSRLSQGVLLHGSRIQAQGTHSYTLVVAAPLRVVYDDCKSTNWLYSFAALHSF
ncbi:hypothetical protein Hypma_014473 [Hypsizygus marmoreus]|uniref:Uncharacterized protein n=1 Tax=Hypsizygus marmoreus TaxID=39966 RepID=A0A369JF71_HYPMA|nr:hypothetical protein Hypma_014473 [Hypsizygus marmoreus]